MRSPDRLRTERLLLRRVRPDDEAAMLEVHTDPDTNRHRPAGTPSVTQVRADLHSWIEEWQVHGIGYWAIVHSERKDVLGFGGLRHGSHEETPVLNLYYRLRPEAWGYGYAPEMASEAVDWARKNRPERPVVVRTRPDNTAAQSVARRLGFVRHAERVSGEVLEWIYGLPGQELTMFT